MIGAGDTDGADAEVFQTRDGVSLTMRPLVPEDKAALNEAFEHLSDQTRYRRFLRPLRHLAERDLAYLTDLDHRDHEALVAIAPGGEIVGVARFIRVDERPSAAEVAVTVADEWQHQGIGTALLTRLARRARQVGVESFVGLCFAWNRDMLELLEELGPAVRRRREDGGVVELEIELPTDADHREVRPALRAVARAPFPR